MSTPTTVTDLEALADGLASPFWTLFAEHVTREWGPAGLRYQQAVRNAAKDPQAVIELQKVLHTQEQLLLLMQWPHDRLTTLRDKARASLSRPQNPSRRGPGM